MIDFNSDSTSFTNTGQFIIALSVESFSDVSLFKRNVDEVIRSMQASPKLPGFDKVRVPGERSLEIRRQREQSGIPIPDALCEALSRLASSLKTEPLGLL